MNITAKRLLFAVAAFILSTFPAKAEIIGETVQTDIGVLIDGMPIETYNIGGRTFVAAENLRGYGFDVNYDDTLRRLTVTQNPYSERTLPQESVINISKENITVGEHFADIYKSDIKVYADDTPIEAYSLDGFMIIPVRALEMYAYINYDDDARIVRIGAIKHYLDVRCAEGSPFAEKEEREYEGIEVYDHSDEHTENMVSVKEESITYTEGGRIEYYTGNPIMTVLDGGTYYQTEAYPTSYCAITDEEGRIIYETNAAEYTPYSGYTITGDRAQRFNKFRRGKYGISVTLDKDYYQHLEDDITSYELIPEKIIKIIGSRSVQIITQNGYLIEVSPNGDRQLVRYGVRMADSEYVLSTDSVLYLMNNEYESIGVAGAADGSLFESFLENMHSQRNIEMTKSIFDKAVSNDVQTYKYGCTLQNGGKLYNRADMLIADGVKDFAALEGVNDAYFFITVDESGNMYSGTQTEYINGLQKEISSGIKSVYGAGKEYYFITEADELYKCAVSDGVFQKIADGVLKVFINEESEYDSAYLTSDNRLMYTDGELITDNVKDASFINAGGVILKYDSSIWQCTNLGGKRELEYITAF